MQLDHCGNSQPAAFSQHRRCQPTVSRVRSSCWGHDLPCSCLRRRSSAWATAACVLLKALSLVLLQGHTNVDAVPLPIRGAPTKVQLAETETHPRRQVDAVIHSWCTMVEFQPVQ